LSIFDERGFYIRHPAETGGQDGKGCGLAAIVGIILALILFAYFKRAG